ncbi:hypothetical protein N657DRAFT_644748 [Parathielavia appendiculata]|uniref:DUF7600 domain-containing protein n=1 Tax=Parathielavia appendiculata TaxID=2587402 RepID=A0AAN6Z4C2_9PEZI|nr:hypothetical protein N657DRAFT_644748 [Parathielavia appendiculata]
MPRIWSLDLALPATGYRVEVNGLLWTPKQLDDHRFYNGCHLSQTQFIAISNTLAQLFVYTVTFGDGRYVVGISLVTVAGDSIRLEYSSSCKHSIELTQICGFRVTIGSRGLQAPQCIIGSADVESPWMMCLDRTVGPRRPRGRAGSWV